MKKMKTKRLVAVLLTLAMVLGMTLTAFAGQLPDGSEEILPPVEEEEKPANTNVTTPTVPATNITTEKDEDGNPTGTTPGGINIVLEDAKGKATDRAPIVVKGLPEGLTVTAYQIIEANYLGAGDTFSGYKALYNEVVQNRIDVTGSAVNINQEQLTEILTYINKNGSIAGAATGTGKSEIDLKTGAVIAKIDNLPVGSYLVIVTGAEGTIYNPIVASTYYVNKDGGNAVAGVDLDIAQNPGWVKSTTPQVNKYIVEDGVDKKGNSVTIGAIIDYKIEVMPIPKYDGEFPKFTLTDQLSTGLERVTPLENIVVSIGQTTGSAIVVTQGAIYNFTSVETDKKQFVIDFVVDGRYTLNDFANNPANKIFVTYQARVTEDAELNQVGNTNDVTLTYSKNSTVDGDEGTDKDKVYSYTFDIDGTVTGNVINKTEEDLKTGLPGAEFGIYSADKYDEQAKEVSGDPIAVATTTADGQMYFKGLKAGTYYLKETKAPDGYSLNTNIYKIEISVILDDDAPKTEKGKIKSWTIKVNNVMVASGTPGEGETTGVAESIFNVDNGTVSSTIESTKIPNTKLSGLPSTGGIGTTIFTIAGCLIMILAAALFFASRRKTSKK